MLGSVFDSVLDSLFAFPDLLASVSLRLLLAGENVCGREVLEVTLTQTSSEESSSATEPIGGISPSS